MAEFEKTKYEKNIVMRHDKSCSNMPNYVHEHG